jgi:hypothetical protein
MIKREYFRLTKCKKCGKEFAPAAQHRYKEGAKYYCTWTCYNHRHDEDKIGEEVFAYGNNQN